MKRIVNQLIRSSTFFFSFVLILPLSSVAQPADSARLFTQEEFFRWILDYHPVVKQARLLDAQAEALERLARGGFDPKAYAEWDQKSFEKKEYFSIGEGGLKVPTWYGVELKAAYTITDGIYLNPERNLPEAGQAVVGLKVPLARGLIIDERRAALQQARLMAQANEAERLAIINDLLLEAASAYWEWARAFNELGVQQGALALAQQRLGAIVESFIQGDKPAIDTLETLIQVQNRQLALNDAQVGYRNAGLQLSNFLWYEGEVPVEITERLRPPLLEELPPTLPALGPDAIWNNARFSHPEIRRYEVKISQLEVDRRLAAEQLKPGLDVEYNFLSNGNDFIYDTGDGSGFNNLVTQNYKWGLRFDFPLLLRKERGKLELSKLKIQDAELGLQQKRIEIANKIGAYFNELQNLLRQIRLTEDNVGNYQALLNAEIQKFNLGESSIFLINSREQKLIDAQLKLLELRGKFFKNRMGLEWAAGQLGG
ncbi:MAG: TolC family protein [Phaeodactylibacter sp.]|nr:TolC family protein [Phaeodactylibacter sp.]MCB9051114.1 TolC family protein [Lewinellaceae bacterium]